MTIRNWSLTIGTLTLAVLLVVRAPTRAEEDPPPDPTPKGVEVQARGPVHEAFAEPTESRPLPSAVVTTQPPAAIDELPPDEKPAGDNIQWIPGYWGWDEEQKDFLWISGFWRVPPPNRQWVPGSWQQVEDGWQWTSGFWALANQQEVQYLPAPPPSVDTGASIPAPDDNSIYSPGCWVYRENRYYWRPGFWVPFQANWIWIPAHYVWSPAGYVFVEGYWDHPLEQRGLLFAPIRIDRALVTAEWTYTPHYVVQSDFLIGALFVRPNHGHYYFGDFFEERYKERGYTAWVDYRPSKESYDPNFAHYRHQFNGDETWERNLRGLYAARTAGTVERPPHTLVQQNTFIKNITVNKTENVTVNKTINLTHVQNVSVLAPVTRINNTKVTSLAALGSEKSNAHKVETHVIRTEAVPKEQKIEVHKAVTTFRETADKRHVEEAKILSQGGHPVKATDPARTVKIELPKAPAPVQVTTPDRPKPLPVKEAPKAPVLPKHEEKIVIPAHEPPPAPKPPKPPKPEAPKPVTPPPPPKTDPPKPPPQPPAPKEPPHKDPPPPPPKEPPHKDPPPPPPKEPPHKDPPPPPPKEPPAPPKPPPPPKDPPPPPPKEPPAPPKPPPPAPPKEPPHKDPPPPPPKEPPPAPKPPPPAPKEPPPAPKPPPAPPKEPPPAPKPPVAKEVSPPPHKEPSAPKPNTAPKEGKPPAPPTHSDKPVGKTK